MRNRRLRCATLLVKVLSCFVLTPVLASATTLSFTGNLDPANANDVYLASFTLPGMSSLHVQSWGYGGTSFAPGATNATGLVISPGGFDPYISLFRGSGPSATFLTSNDDGGCGPAAPDPVCEDFRLDVASLAAGTYTLALSLPHNFSFAENYGSGNLGDGFIGLQSDYYDYASDTVRTSAYAFDMTYVAGGGTTPSPVPEPSSFVLLASGLAVSLTQVRRRLAASK